MKNFSLHGVGASIADFGSKGPRFESDRRRSSFFFLLTISTSIIYLNFLITYSNGRPHFEIGNLSGFSTVSQKGKNSTKVKYYSEFPITSPYQIFLNPVNSSSNLNKSAKVTIVDFLSPL